VRLARRVFTLQYLQALLLHLVKLCLIVLFVEQNKLIDDCLKPSFGKRFITTTIRPSSDDYI